MAENGKISIATEQQLEGAAPPPSNGLFYTMDDLSSYDLKRAKSGPLADKDYGTIVSDPLDQITLTIWCIASRTNPDFSWDQAERTPHSWLNSKGEVPPQIEATPGTSGSESTSSDHVKPSATKS